MRVESNSIKQKVSEWFLNRVSQADFSSCSHPPHDFSIPANTETKTFPAGLRRGRSCVASARLARESCQVQTVAPCRIICTEGYDFGVSFISMIKWVRTSRLSIKNSLSRIVLSSGSTCQCCPGYRANLLKERLQLPTIPGARM